jgi:hypothetical protein
MLFRQVPERFSSRYRSGQAALTVDGFIFIQQDGFTFSTSPHLKYFPFNVTIIFHCRLPLIEMKLSSQARFQLICHNGHHQAASRPETLYSLMIRRAICKF